jgi:hypothetical protein
VSDPNGDAITFAKVSGPAWLSVAGNGGITGMPLSPNAGGNVFVVRATDSSGLSGSATMNLLVAEAPPIVLSAGWQGSSLLLMWSGGIAPYQVQCATQLPADWQNLGTAVSGNSMLLAPSNPATFYRVLGQ